AAPNCFSTLSRSAAESNSIRSHTSARRSLRNTDQWSATLAPMVRHTLWLDLASRLPEGMVILPGESKPATMQSIDVVVGDLSSTRAGS
ncbi:MAG TPA: hypothetical protein VF980_12650, partial [Thermoanaerobaculia bacterium]